MTSLLELLVAVVFLLLNAFFVLAEFALVKVRFTRLEVLASRGDQMAALAKEAVQHMDAYLAAIQLGITMASLGLGWIGEPALSHLLEPLFAWLPGQIGNMAAHIAAASILAFVLITSLHVVVGELMPKSIAV